MTTQTTKFDGHPLLSMLLSLIVVLVDVAAAPPCFSLLLLLDSNQSCG